MGGMLIAWSIPLGGLPSNRRVIFRLAFLRLSASATHVTRRRAAGNIECWQCASITSCGPRFTIRFWERSVASDESACASLQTQHMLTTSLWVKIVLLDGQSGQQT